MRPRHLAAWALLAAVWIAFPGCGKKAPPFLPKNVYSIRVAHLKAVRQGDQVELKGALVGPQERTGKKWGVVTCRVFHIRYSLQSPPCEGCPIPFGSYEEVKPEILEQGTFRCTVSLGSAEGIYFFMVRLVNRNGIVGPPSDRAKMVVEHR